MSNLLKCWGVRGSQIGDSVAALSVYAWVRQQYPQAYTYWQVARKHIHAVPLFYNHPLIDQLVISDCAEGMGPRDIEIAKTCNFRFNTMPEHVPGETWPNLRSFYAETFRMSDLPEEIYRLMLPELRRPRLTQWFPVERQQGVIGYWPCAAYGQTQVIWENGERVVKSRNASRPWALALVDRLRAEGYRVVQFGHPNDFADSGGGLNVDIDARQRPFMDQIIAANRVDVNIGTDSGAAIVLGAYGVPQVSLLTNHYPAHTQNLTAFEPDNPNNISLVGVGSADSIPLDSVVAAVKQVTS